MIAACSSFSNCIDCLDVNNNDVIDDGDCAACAPGTVMADDNAQCLGESTLPSPTHMCVFTEHKLSHSNTQLSLSN